MRNILFSYWEIRVKLIIKALLVFVCGIVFAQNSAISISAESINPVNVKNGADSFKNSYLENGIVDSGELVKKCYAVQQKMTPGSKEKYAKIEYCVAMDIRGRFYNLSNQVKHLPTIEYFDIPNVVTRTTAYSLEWNPQPSWIKRMYEIANQAQ